MKILFRTHRIVIALSFVAVVLGVAGCDSNPAAPGISRVFLEDGTVDAGATNTLYVEVFLDTEDTGDEFRVSKPFSLVITLPPGASYVTGTSAFSYGPVREPNVIGACDDGRSYLSYDFAAGEADNSFNFQEFAEDLAIQVLLQASADDQVAGAVSDALPIPDPCKRPSASEVTFRVNSN